jgi:hypothetical protein
MFPVAFQAIGKSKNTLLATEIAKVQMENVRGASFASVVDRTLSPAATAIINSDGRQTQIDFNAKINVTQPFTTVPENTKIKLVRIQVKSYDITRTDERKTAITTVNLETLKGDI